MSDFSAKIHQILPLPKNAMHLHGRFTGKGRAVAPSLSPSSRYIVKGKIKKRMCARQESGLDAIAAMTKVELRVVVEIKFV